MRSFIERKLAKYVLGLRPIVDVALWIKIGDD